MMMMMSDGVMLLVNSLKLMMVMKVGGCVWGSAALASLQMMMSPRATRARPLREGP